MSTSGDQDAPREVLSSLPRSRRQRPSARREAARAAGAAAPKQPAAVKATAVKPKAKPKAKAAPRAAARKPPPKRSAIPPAGYATPREGRGHGSADPAAAVADLVRGILRRLPLR
jgi:hypothetical protein